jgi:sec-independent protein translocase protein TatC
MSEELAHMTLGEHLEELRRCLLRTLIGVGVGMGLCLLAGEHLFRVMFWPLAVGTIGQPPKLFFSSLAEPFAVYLRVCLVAGAILSSPYGLWQMWAFISAGLYQRERRAARKYVLPSLVLFLFGVAFFLVVVAPMMVRFFLVFARGNFPLPPGWAVERLGPVLGGAEAGVATQPAGGGYVSPVLMIGEYVTLVATLSLVFGLSFQTPLVVLFLVRSGMVPIESLRRFRRYVFLVILVFAALFTPPDPLSMVALSAPMYLLYELGLVAAGWGGRSG